MRKRIIIPAPREVAPPDQEWLDVEGLAEVEVTSEDPSHPIESALLPGGGPGWRAESPGQQTVRLIFDEPQRLRRIWLRFEESRAERTQEFVLCWSADCGQSFHEVLRQQWNFSPSGATREIEDLHVELPAVTLLELTIIPDISRRPAHASLAQLRVG